MEICNNTELELKNYVGKKLLSIIDMDTDQEIIKNELNKITKGNYHDIDEAKILLFENGEALIFVDYDCDGYRSGEWNLISVEKILDKDSTKGIKNINSKVINIEFKENINSEDCVLITTEDYVISMGQNYSDSYYPRNFFSVEECKKYALGKMRLIK